MLNLFTVYVKFFTIVITINNISFTKAAFLNPLDRISNDFLALTTRVTARHILLPKSTEAALALKQKIRNRVNNKEEPSFVVDAFAAAAERFSLDEETSNRGGLLGELVPQGYCRTSELDEACFQLPIGEIYGPIESSYGYHLLLICERTNCQKLDGTNSKLSRGKDGTSSALTKSFGKDSTQQLVEVAIGQFGFWIFVGLSGGVFAEMAARVA